MDQTRCKDTVDQHQEQLLTVLERLLALPMTAVYSTLKQVVGLVTEALAAEKVDVFLHDPATDTLLALSASDTLISKQRQATGAERLQLANGGPLIEVFLTGIPYLSGHAKQDAGELVGMKSEIAVVVEVEARYRGVLWAASSTAEFFSEHDLRFLQAVARWVGIAIHRLQLAERMKQEAIEREQCLATEKLLTIMAHDPPSYLTPIKGRLERLELRANHEGREQDAQDAAAASNTLNQLGRVVSNLLDVACLNYGIFPIHQQPINLVHLVQEVVAAFSRPEIPVYVHACQEMVLSADPARLRQVLESLLVKAIKDAPVRSTITIRVSRKRRKDGPWMILTLSNVGPEPLPKLGTRFLRPFLTDMTATDLGLGLYLANRIAVAHNGRLILDSLGDQGIQAILALPMEDEDWSEHDHVGSCFIKEDSANLISYS